jgi:pimeloyl-ACP methyl ester carboxylesterase
LRHDRRGALAVDRIVRLQDGRSMSYAQYGSPDGFPIVNAHGGLACRLDVAAADAIAAAAGVRLISPDRPGVGRSDPRPGRTIDDWARDVAGLLDLIDVDRFAVMGWSMGGQYAAAVGHALPHRVTRVAIIAGALPLTEPGVFDELPAMDRVLTRAAVRTPWLAAQWFRVMRFVAGAAPTLYGRLAARELGAADGAIIRDDGFATFARMSHEALLQPAGAVEEYRAWLRPWGFTPEELTVPVDVWAGTRDELVDQSWPHRLASRIPSATLNIRDGGHFMAHRYYREIFDALTR